MFNLWTDEDIIIREVNGNKIECLNLEATRRVYAFVSGKDASDKNGNLPVAKAIEVLKNFKPAEVKPEEVKPEEVKPEEVKPVEEKPAEDILSGVGDIPTEEESEPFVIMDKYKSLINSLVHSINPDELTENELIRFFVDGVDQCPGIYDLTYGPMVIDELSEQIRGAYINEYGLCPLTIFQIENVLKNVINYFENLTNNDEKVFNFLAITILRNELYSFLKFIELNFSNRKYEEYKLDLFAYLISNYVDKNSGFYDEKFGKNDEFTLKLLHSVGLCSNSLFNILVNCLTDEFKKENGIRNYSVDENDIYSEEDIERYGKVYESWFGKKEETDSIDDLTESPNPFDVEPTELPKPRFANPFDAEPTELPKPRFANPFASEETEEEHDDKNDKDDEEEKYEVTRKGQLTKDEKISLYVAGASGLLLVFTALFGINPKTAIFEKQYGGVGAFSYNALTIAFAISLVYKAAKAKLLEFGKKLLPEDDFDFEEDSFEEGPRRDKRFEPADDFEDDTYTDEETRKFRRFEPADDFDDYFTDDDDKEKTKRK